MRESRNAKARDAGEDQPKKIAKQSASVAGINPSWLRMATRVTGPAADAVDGDPPAGGGRELDQGVRARLERGFGTGLERVTIHDDASARGFVRARRAEAVTFGQDIYLARSLADGGGSQLPLLAHEVAHTLQQRGAAGPAKPTDVRRYAQLEREADRAAASALVMHPSSPPTSLASPMLQASADDSAGSLDGIEAMCRFLGHIPSWAPPRFESEPERYDRLARGLIDSEADRITDVLLETWVDDEDEDNIVSAIDRWATTPKLDGGNYLDVLLDEIRGYRYRFDYLITESAWGNMLDKLFAEMEDSRRTRLHRIVDNFSTRYAGYRGRGGIDRFSGLQTAVMPEDVRARISRINQRLAGRTTLPLTDAEIERINSLYARLRDRTLGLIDMPDVTIMRAPGHHAAALAAPAVGVGALLYALLLAIIVVVVLALIIEILDELERALDRMEFRGRDPDTAPPIEIPIPAPPIAPPIPVPPVDVPAPPVDTPAPPVDVPAPPIDVPVPPVPAPEAEPQPRPESGRPRPDAEPRPGPRPRPDPEPRPEPRPPVDPPPPIPDTDEPPDQEPEGEVDFFHGSSEADAIALLHTPVLAIGGGEFGQGFYTFLEEPPAQRVAADYTRSRGGASWGVIGFSVPARVLLDYGLTELLIGQGVLAFPDRRTPVDVTYPADMGGITVSMTWQEFVDENRRYRRLNGFDISWPYDLIIGPLSGRLSGFSRDLNQYTFNDYGVTMLNDPRVGREVTSTGIA